MNAGLQVNSAPKKHKLPSFIAPNAAFLERVRALNVGLER